MRWAEHPVSVLPVRWQDTSFNADVRFHIPMTQRRRDHSHKDPRHRPLITENHNHVSEYFSPFAQNKSECVLRILEGRLGQENLLEILTRMLEVKEDAVGDLLPCMVTYKEFLNMANERVPQRWKELLLNWVECEGFAHFKVTLIYNSSDSPNYLTVRIVQDTDRQADIFKGNIKVGVQEVDRYEEHIIRIETRVRVCRICVSIVCLLCGGSHCLRWFICGLCLGEGKEVLLLNSCPAFLLYRPPVPALALSC